LASASWRICVKHFKESHKRFPGCWLAAVDHTLSRLKLKEVRIGDEFHSIYSPVLLDQEKCGLDPFVVPRSQKVPRRLNPDGAAEAHVFPDALSLHRVCYFTMFDVAHSELNHVLIKTVSLFFLTWSNLY
jgi:hypothetical protein